MSHSTSVNLSIETVAESKIQEISYDGQEIFQPEVSPSENLSKLAQKIDFSEANEDSDQLKLQSNEQSDVPLSGWIDSVVSTLKKAATEINVLSDVIAITREKEYMILDPIPKDLIEIKPMAQVHLYKKGLQNASNIIMSAVNRLNNQYEFMKNQTTPDYHKELLRLRQNWRLKKVSDTIIGDLSFKTAGSKFGQAGMFQVTKAEINLQPIRGISSCSSSSSACQNVQIIKRPSTLNVTIPTELQGISFIMITCQKDQENLFKTSFSLSGSHPAALNQNMHWQHKLEAAQNVLFCKELFNHLAKEAVELQATIPHIAMGNQISATVFPGIQLMISLCHSSPNSNYNCKLPSKSDHNHVLEHSLHQLLREVHHKNSHHSLHHILSKPNDPNKCRVNAGPTSMDRFDVLKMSESQTILEQIIEQAQHTFMRSHTEYIIDTLAKEINDPIIVPHWTSSNSPTQSCVKITILSREFDCISRSSLIVHVMKKSLKCIFRDGRVINLSYEPQELRDLIFCQINQHQVAGVQAVAKAQGWKCLASSSQLGLGSVEAMGNASSCLLASPLGNRLLSVKCEPQGNVSVCVGYSPKKDFFGGQLVKEKKWENLEGSFKEVRMDKMEGKNLLNKMELLMGCLTSSTY